MAWINMMAQQVQQGLPVNVGSLMDSLVQQQGGSSPDLSQGAAQGNAGVAGLLSGLKERRFKA
jgi:hypothetical protein